MFACALGRGGRQITKREGDGATPVGTWRIIAIYYRADRTFRWIGPRLGVALPQAGRARVLHGDDGWCDAPGDANYNRFVRHPYPASAEHLWRDDHLYDICLVLDHNQCPRVRNHGSAIFLHVARRCVAQSGQARASKTAARDRRPLLPTEGCVAVGSEDVFRMIAHLRPGARVQVRW